MIEIRFHGRGGQGTVVASKLLATSLFLDGKYTQSLCSASTTSSLDLTDEDVKEYQKMVDDRFGRLRKRF